MLMVTVAEVNRSAARSIGIDFNITKGAFAFMQNTGSLIPAGAAAAGGAAAGAAAGQAITQVSSNVAASIDNGSVLMAIQALRTLDFARSLAEPNLTTLNGRPASSMPADRFPFPSAWSLPAARRRAWPTRTSASIWSSRRSSPIAREFASCSNAEVSTRSDTTTSVAGASVPSEVDKRNFTNTVELREGQTLTVAGLIQNNFGGHSDRVPWWGDLPIIGRTGGLDK